MIDAKSGWGHRDEAITISGADHTRLVLALARTLEYRLPENQEKDQGVPGQHAASHAEKQLAMYFVKKHVFLPDEARYFDNTYTRIVLHNTTTFDGNIAKFSFQPQCTKMYMCAPPSGLRCASVSVSNRPCEDCQSFVSKLNAVLNVTINLDYRV